MLIIYLLAILPFYLLGSFPTGLLLAKLSGADLLNQGSGSVGATNVARVLGRKAGIITLVIDVFKGFFGVLVGRYIFNDPQMVAAVAVAVVLGHCYSIPGYLRGGKGVATSLGVLFAISPITAIVALSTFIGVVIVTKIVSLASICAALISPLVMVVSDSNDYLMLAVCIMGFTLVWRHKQNIERLICGTEPKFIAKN